MSEPTPKQTDPTRPAVQQPGKDGAGVESGRLKARPEGDRLEAYPTKTDPTRQIPVAKRLEAAANGEVARLKSSRVISKSYRVLELPPPPVIMPPAEQTETDEAPHRDTLPDGLAALPEGPADVPERPPEPPIELDALQIRAAGRWNFVRRGVRIPPRWEQWLTDPQRRNNIGVGLSVAIHVAVIVLLTLVLRVPAGAPAVEPIDARTVLPAGVETGPDNLPHVVPVREPPVREPIVRQIIPGALETVAIEPPANLESEISDLKAKNAEQGRQEPETQIEPPAKMAVEGAASPTGPDAHTAVPPASVAPADDGVPGMADGSRLPPDLMQAIDTFMQGKLKRRTPGGRSEGVRYKGGTPRSEEAVERALGWLAVHQRQDGSWNFNHLSDACQHYCTGPGSEGSTTAATGLALLPFLGAGYTHKEGPFQDVVEHGLNYLKSRSVKISYGNDLRDGSMYGHALATIALCEAYGMTRDAELKEVAQGALDYVGYCQDGNTGGWRYNPGEPGDTTVTGWMLMALKSGQMARLEVKSPTIMGAERFLDSVQNKDGSQYGYQSRKPRRTMTAVALLCRMYTGWRRDNPGLVQGVAHLNDWGFAKNSLYYDYYATQVLFHWAGPEWDTWNDKMRDYLISTQEREGHPTGSWYFESEQSAAGGRLYNTAMATMILEVYYRFMPLYGEEAVEQK